MLLESWKRTSIRPNLNPSRAMDLTSMTIPHYVNEDKSDMRGIKPGWYAMGDDYVAKGRNHLAPISLFRGAHSVQCFSKSVFHCERLEQGDRGEPPEPNLEADLSFDGPNAGNNRVLNNRFRARNHRSRGARCLYMGRVSLLHFGYPESRSHHSLPRAGEAEYQQALPGSAERQWALDWRG